MGLPAFRLLPGDSDPEPDPIVTVGRAAEAVRAAADAFGAALDAAEAAGLALRVRVVPPLGRREGWHVEVEGAGW
ncbi:MAG TPA: hypothetical protein VK610_05325 [Rhodothermales bacterium]|nr:hypothetical protein [Rhodothermales bacterium]